MIFGERGATGDHGQAGADGHIGDTGIRGERGDRGERGPAGQPTNIDAMHVKRSDRRLLMLYIVGMVLVGVVGFTQVRSEHDRQHFQLAVVANCQANRANVVRFNAALDTIAASLPEPKRAKIKAGKGVVADCPPSGSARP